MSEPALLYAELNQYTSHNTWRGVNPVALMELSDDPQITFLAALCAKLADKIVFFQTKHGGVFMVAPYDKIAERQAFGAYAIPKDKKWSVDKAHKFVFDRTLPMGPRWNVPVQSGTVVTAELLVEANSPTDAERMAQAYLNALTDEGVREFLIDPQHTQLVNDLHDANGCDDPHLFKLAHGQVQEASEEGYCHLPLETLRDL